jgi:hypothetical protein
MAVGDFNGDGAPDLAIAVQNKIDSTTYNIVSVLLNTAETIAGSIGTGTIQDDDPAPSVALSLTGSPLTDNGGMATVTATLSAVSGLDTTVNLGFSGTATYGTNYTASATSIVIPAGDTSGGITLTGIDDGLNDGDKTIVVDIADVANGTEADGFQQVTATVTAVNEAPSFTKGAGQTVLEDAGARTVAGWATAISAGPADEAGQALNFLVSTDNAGLFAAGPAIAADGTLTYTPAANANGSATVTVQLHDDGGTANGGVDTSPAQTFTITVTPVNDAPSFTKGANQAVAENAGAQTVVGWATAISAGPADEAGQALNFLVSTNNKALFAAGPVIAADGTLTYTPATNATGSATVTVRLHDDGGTANGGADTSAPQTFTIKVVPVPTLTSLSQTSALEDSAGFTLIVNGTNFVKSSKVDWNGKALSTTFVSSTQLQAMVPASRLAEEGNYTITVVNPAPAGASNALAFSVVDPPLTTSGTTVYPTAGTSFTGVVATFSDAPSDPANDFKASIAWGDGHTSKGTIKAQTGGGFTVTGTHKYAAAGTFTISVTITDIGSSVTTVTSTAVVGKKSSRSAGNPTPSPAGGAPLVGDTGADQLVGSRGPDLLGAETTSHEAKAQELDAILAEWASGPSAAARVANAGRDWFFAQLGDVHGLAKDKLTVRSGTEFADDLTFFGW